MTQASLAGAAVADPTLTGPRGPVADGSPRERDLYASSVLLDTARLGRFRCNALEHGFGFEHDGTSILALGVAAHLELPQGLADTERADSLHALIAAIRTAGPTRGREASGGGADECAIGPIALGSLPFDRRAPAGLVIPRLVAMRRGAGPTVATVVGEDPDLVAALARNWADEPDQMPSSALLPWDPAGVPGTGTGTGTGTGPRTRPGTQPAPGAPPDQFRLRSARSHAEFKDLVARAVASIRASEFEKVVLVREVIVEANRALSPRDMVERLRALYPSCAAFSMGGFVGASPELLAERSGLNVRSHPLAGTVGRSGDPATDARLEAALLGSPKERAEHQAVVGAIAEALAPLCDELELPDGPSIVELRNVSHLGTMIRGRLSTGEPADGGTGPGSRAAAASTAPPSALGLVARLHPTPAVAGTPRQPALAWLAEHEGVERGPYAGPVGWLDGAGDGEWYIGIRAALVDGARARLFAGVGIVADSDPDTELVETQLKLQAILAAAVRP
jgi:menaquinone-specific isochorismate synthase